MGGSPPPSDFAASPPEVEPPVVTAAIYSTSQNRLDVTFSKPMDTTRNGEQADFSVRANGTLRGSPGNRTWVTSVTLRMSTWLASSPNAGPDVWNYHPSGNALRSADGGVFAGGSDMPIAVI